LFAVVKRVQLGVRILLAHVERGETVLKAIVSPVAEDARTEIHIVENKAAKVRVERLQTAPERDEIVVVRQVPQMDFHERLLQGEERLGAFRVSFGAKAVGGTDLAIEQRIDVARIKHESVARRW